MRKALVFLLLFPALAAAQPTIAAVLNGAS